MWRRAYAWARHQIALDLQKSLSTALWRHSPEYEEFTTKIEGRDCKLLVRNFGAEVTVSFRRDMLPRELRLNETSDWGPQLHEAWTSGEAIQTGDVEFDLAFVVLSADAGALPDRQKARLIAPELRRKLLALRQELRDADIFSGHLRLSIDGWSATRPRTVTSQHPLLWAMGRAFLKFDRMLSAQVLERELMRTVRLAGDLDGEAGAR